MIHFSIVIIENLGFSHFSSLLLNLLVSHFVCPWYWTFLLLFLCLLFNILFTIISILSQTQKSPLGIRGHIALIDSVLCSLPLYFSFFWAPKKVLNKLNGIRRNFLWCGSRNTSKIAWISWERAPKEKCGLGIKNLYLFNISLLSKWRWRFLQDSLQFGPLLLDLDMVVLSLIYPIWPTKLVCF